MTGYSQETNRGTKKTERVATPVKKETTDMEEHKVIKQAKDHDVEEAESNRNRVYPAVDKAIKEKPDPEGLESTVHNGAEKAAEARKRINNIEENLEKDKKRGKISDAEYKLRKDKIEKARQAVDELEKHVKEGEELQKLLP